MAQVVTNENMQEFIQNRSVPEFKAPEAKSSDASAAAGLAGESSKEGSSPATDASKDTPRDLNTGKFVKADGEKEPKVDEAAKAAGDDDEDDVDLPERVRRQMGKKHRMMKEAEEFGREEYRARKAAEDRAAALEARLKELESKSGPKSDKGADAPKPEDFKTVAEYADALTDHLLEKKLAKRDAKREEEQTQTAQQREIEKNQADLATRVEKLEADIPDFKAIVETIPDDFLMPPVMARYFVQNPLMLYHIQKAQPAELVRLTKLPPIDAIERLGELKAELMKKPNPATPAASAKPNVSRAPAPITPLDGSSTTVTKPESEMTFQELRAKRDAERKTGKYR